ncbi:hypothetical protein NDU88_001431 [Pleurodeles waltl]|uniref:Uncharacterized protein n=1 Tax=Pleurodeles waltl TaxID=8319 RepID=A0AAV7THS6_PLEWA|nr:hypothetical protein NDU88_001431 [Pleurodeles waltl]
MEAGYISPGRENKALVTPSVWTANQAGSSATRSRVLTDPNFRSKDRKNAPPTISPQPESPLLKGVYKLQRASNRGKTLSPLIARPQGSRKYITGSREQSSCDLRHLDRQPSRQFSNQK